MAGKQNSSLNEARRILKKYPEHLPVICMNEDESDKRKLLVPVKMKASELLTTARSRCPWASEESSLLIGGKLLENAQTANEIYANHKAQDGFLYVHVTEKAVGQPEEEPKQEESQKACMQPAASSGATSPPVFHMPDNDEHTLSGDAKKARKVLKKYPDRIPVLVKQAATAGLPAIDRKLLVPRTMTCAGLQAILPKHLGIPEAGNVAWDKLRISMGDDPLPATAVMSEVYMQYVDDNDAILHVSLWIDMPFQPVASSNVEATVDEQHEQESWQAPSLEEAKEAQKLLEEVKQELEKTAKESAAFKAQAEAAESSAATEANRAMAAEARAVAAEEKAAHMGQAFLGESEKVVQLQAALSEAVATEEKAAHMGQALMVESEKVAQLQAALSEATEKIKALEEAQTLTGSELLALREQFASKTKETSQEAEALQQKLRTAELVRVQAEQKLTLEAECARATEAALEQKMEQQIERAELAEKAKEAALEVARAEAARANLQEEEGKNLRAELKLLNDRLTEELVAKSAAEEQVRSLGERLSAIQAEAEKVEEAKKKYAEKLAEQQKKKQEEGEGFVHLGWDRDGFASELDGDDNEFELLVADEA